jgi:hypothetical protein
MSNESSRAIMTKKPKYITAFDPIIKERVLFILKDGWAISLITGHKFRYEVKKMKNKKESD